MDHFRPVVEGAVSLRSVPSKTPAHSELGLVGIVSLFPLGTNKPVASAEANLGPVPVLALSHAVTAADLAAPRDWRFEGGQDERMIGYLQTSFSRRSPCRDGVSLSHEAAWTIGLARAAPYIWWCRRRRKSAAMSTPATAAAARTMKSGAFVLDTR
jgi:hypothetical protein